MAAASMAMTAAALIGDVPGCWGCCLVAHALRCVALPCLALPCLALPCPEVANAIRLFRGGTRGEGRRERESRG